MATTLQTINDLLTTVGELPAADIDGIVARKALLALQQSITFVSSLYRWPHLRTEVVSTSWVGSTVANLPAFQSVISVFLEDSKEKVLLGEATYEDVQSHAFDDAGAPTMWTHRDQRSLLFPPVSLAFQPKVKFFLLLSPTIPINKNDEITLDPQFLQCVMLYAEQILHRTHTTDLASGAAAYRQFEVELQTLRTRRESDSPTQWRF